MCHTPEQWAKWISELKQGREYNGWPTDDWKAWWETWPPQRGKRLVPSSSGDSSNDEPNLKKQAVGDYCSAANARDVSGPWVPSGLLVMD